ncbi:hypothetical protein VN97_g9847 [Penicillium thymicola]|uniref:Uncharacterized protein n=1 Tax=Penicillium thymicola TaxID=293382 RepID=A0AAI9TA58_PENTH|nr:hypothetical protein VN97_g9847 [Penicillium thymicola]
MIGFFEGFLPGLRLGNGLRFNSAKLFKKLKDREEVSIYAMILGRHPKNIVVPRDSQIQAVITYRDREEEEE